MSLALASNLVRFFLDEIRKESSDWYGNVVKWMAAAYSPEVAENSKTRKLEKRGATNDLSKVSRLAGWSVQNLTRFSARYSTETGIRMYIYHFNGLRINSNIKP